MEERRRRYLGDVVEDVAGAGRGTECVDEMPEEERRKRQRHAVPHGGAAADGHQGDVESIREGE